MNTNPPAVTIGPPRLIEPGGTDADAPPKPCIEPSGTCQRIDSVLRSSATSCPHGGGLHGNPDGDTRNCRNIPYGAPAWRPYSPSSRRRCGSSNSSRGRRRALVGRLFVLTRRRLRLGSKAYPLHVNPPVFPGYSRLPRTLGGVKRPSLRNPLMAVRQVSRSGGVGPHAWSADRRCGVTAGRLRGNGCVGNATSPGTLLRATGRSSTGDAGSPVSRLRM